MVAIRQDAWTEDDDLLLAEVTLRHIREGGTQLAAFEEVGENLNRTSAACGFRWNSLVRKKYETAIQIAKAQRHKRSQKKHTNKEINNVFDNAITEEKLSNHESKIDLEKAISFDSIIRFLKKQKNFTSDRSKNYKTLEKQIVGKSKELELLRRENNQLKDKLKYVETDYRVVNEDYKSLIQIMDRARKMAFLSAEEEDSKSVFKMDSNGNLERIDK